MVTVFTTIMYNAFINNVVLMQFLGICPFLGVSKKIESSLGMSGAVAFVMVIASIVAWLIYNFILVPFQIEYLSTITFILVIASLVQFVELVIKKILPSLYKNLGVYLPLITTNCAILGVASSNIINNYNLFETILTALGSALGFGLVMFAFSAIREHLELANVPVAFKGVPISLVVAGMMALAFSGLSGLITL